MKDRYITSVVEDLGRISKRRRALAKKHAWFVWSAAFMAFVLPCILLLLIG